ncbi:unnamed protein product (macronuclear) [Paramecium tetraurelia]|uniref:TNFR-Cys domain-containing protein n=1 Tax=Paramecium tetraurelia TaxID=5888 RepID=A0CI53_PARTE|nr:uncharacterized protein GSPATT00038574001 [Paramecium tetraurelia]CAK70470.1 unnamed protein product [Paramecium tetraurelia]|eukprot:XP_001437867.1 hypothetical protein (macronuclear) [Paramecium tetraurelia strain d4-2]
MPISIIYILFTLFDASNCQWEINESFLSNDEIFTTSGGSSSENFLLPSSQTSANFITCASPYTSYLTLTNAYPSAWTPNRCTIYDRDWISMDLYFQGTWSSQYVQFTIGTFSYSYTYISPANYLLTTGFCDATPFQVRTLNFTLAIAVGSTYSQLKFTSSNTNAGLVSIRNIFVSSVKCYPSCYSCTGPKYNQCTICHYGIQTNNICPPCPSNQYYQKEQGCRDICDVFSPLYQNGFCQSYPIDIIEGSYFTDPIYDDIFKWSLIYDPQHVDTTPTAIIIVNHVLGVLKYNSGVYQYFNSLFTYSNLPYLIGLQITIMLFNEIPINCGIQFKINNTYYGSIYKNASGIQTHKLKISELLNYGIESTQMYFTVQYDLILYIDIPKYEFVFQAIGNYTDGTAGWGLRSVYFTSGYCSEYCKLCEVSFKCKTCESGYYFYRDGTCIGSCSYPYQRLSGSYCYDYDDETPYSQYLVQEYMDQTGDPEQYAKYKLISQNGSNFLKGSDIYYSYWQKFRVFGGPMVWAQAKFQRVHNINNPHHSVTIAFYILYGPSFPSNGKFIYTIESNTPVPKSTAGIYLINSDGSRKDQIYEKVLHNTNTFTITWECFGPNNEPIKAYLWILQLLYCCSQLLTLLLIMLRLIYMYFMEQHLQFQYCQILLSRMLEICKMFNLSIILFNLYIKTRLLQHVNQLIPNLNQDVLAQSINMKNQINVLVVLLSVINAQVLLTVQNALTTNNRQLSQGNCNCIDGYYPIISNPKCQLCHLFCKTCTGPTSDECLTCNAILNIEKVGSVCRCPGGKSYQYTTKTCSSCHSSCSTCFRTTIDGCLTCNSTLNRLLKGLKCVCAPGYYELSIVCTSCPISENSSLSECYKQCNNNQLIWHTITCSSCDTGFQLVIWRMSTYLWRFINKRI